MGRGLGVLLIAGVLALIVTNPDTGRFREWLKSEIAAEAGRGAGRDPAEDVGRTVGVWLAGMLVEALPIERDNYVVASRFTLTAPDGKSCHFLGVAGQIVALSGDCVPKER